MIALRLSAGVCCLLCLLSFSAADSARAAGVSCTNEQLGKLIPKAQRLDSRTMAVYEELAACQQETIRDHALQWAGFYLVMSGDADGPRRLQSRLAQPEPGSGPRHEMEKARRGDYTALKQMIGAGLSGYYDSPLAQLVLGRALMRDGKYEEAFVFYRDYLRLKPEDDLIAVELLFAYIWAGDLENARHYYQSLTSYKSSPFLQLSLDNAMALIQAATARPTSSSSKDQERAGEAGTMRFNIDERQETVGFERQSVGIGYYGRALQFGLTRHRLISSVYEGAAQGATQAALSGQLIFAKEIGLDATFGYFAAAGSRIYGQLALKGALGSLDYETGVKMEPLALAYPMTDDSLSYLRESGYFQAGWDRWLTLKAALARDERRAPFERYDLRVALPLVREEEDASLLELVFPMFLEHRPKASPFYRSYPQSESLGVGLALSRRSAGRLTFTMNAAYQTIARNSFGEPSHIEFADKLTADLGVSYPWRHDLTLGLSGHYDIEKQEGSDGESWQAQAVLGWVEIRL